MEVRTGTYRDGVTDPASAVLALVRSRPPTLGTGRLVCVDGPAGSGKSTLAAALLARTGSVTVVHMDDLYEGWDGLAGITEQLGPLLGPLAEDRPGAYRRWDWDAGAWAEWITVEPSPLLVVEGVGSGADLTVARATVLVWVEAPHDLRMRRGLERDGEAFAPHWQSWARDETAHFARHRTRERADLLVDGENGSVAVREDES